MALSRHSALTTGLCKILFILLLVSNLVAEESKKILIKPELVKVPSACDREVPRKVPEEETKRKVIIKPMFEKIPPAYEQKVQRPDPGQNKSLRKRVLILSQLEKYPPACQRKIQQQDRGEDKSLRKQVTQRKHKGNVKIPSTTTKADAKTVLNTSYEGKCCNEDDHIEELMGEFTFLIYMLVTVNLVTVLLFVLVYDAFCRNREDGHSESD